jgi:hypothetical protein
MDGVVYSSLKALRIQCLQVGALVGSYELPPVNTTTAGIYTYF